MSFEKAMSFLKERGMGERVRVFSGSSATVALAAHELGCEEKLIAKTMGFDVAGQPLLVVAAGDARIDNHLFKERFGVKARMLTAEQLENEVGFAAGGVCPFGVNAGVPVFLDCSLLRFDTVYPACGSDNSAVAVSPDELGGLSGAKGIVDVCRGWREVEAPQS